MKKPSKLEQQFINQLQVIDEEVINNSKNNLFLILGKENIDKWESNEDIDEINLDEVISISFTNQKTKKQVIDLISNINLSAYIILDEDEYLLLKK